MYILNDDYLRTDHRGKARHTFEHRGLLYNQCYDPSTDVYNPYRIYVYHKDKAGSWTYSHSASGPSIMESILNLSHSLIKYSNQYIDERNALINKVAQVNAILAPADEIDDRF